LDQGRNLTYSYSLAIFAHWALQTIGTRIKSNATEIFVCNIFTKEKLTIRSECVDIACKLNVIFLRDILKITSFVHIHSPWYSTQSWLNALPIIYLITLHNRMHTMMYWLQRLFTMKWCDRIMRDELGRTEKEVAVQGISCYLARLVEEHKHLVSGWSVSWLRSKLGTLWIMYITTVPIWCSTLKYK
jgi:hypothetical protein